MLTFDQLVLPNFDSSTVTVNRSVPNVVIMALGFELTDTELAGLCGAPTGSTVDVSLKRSVSYDPSRKNDVDKFEIVPGGLLLSVRSSAYIASKNEVIVYSMEVRPGQLQYGIYIKLVDFLEKGKGRAFPGIAGCFVKAIVDSASSHVDFVQLRLHAAGGRSWNDRDNTGARWYGYVAWPRYGFDMNVDNLTKALFPLFKYEPKNLNACNKVSDVLALGKSGQEFWKVVGDGWDMSFDLSPSSSSFKTLNAFLQKGA